MPSNTAATLINISKTDEGDRVVFIVNKIDSNATVSFSINNNETLPDQNSENTYTVHRSNIKKDIVITSTSDVDPTVTETQTFTVTGVFDIPEFTSDERSDGASITITPVKVDNAVYSVTVDGTIASEDSDGNYVIPRTASPQNVEIRALPDSNNKGNYVSSQIQKIFIRGNKLDTPQFTHSREGNSIFITKVDVSNATGYNVKVNDSTITAEREGVNAGKYKVMLSTSEQRVKVKALGGKNYISSDDQEITIKAILATPAFTYTLSDDGNTAIIEKVDVENADTYTLTLNGVTLNAETSGDYIGKYLVALTSSEQTVIITASDSSNRYYSSTEELKIKAK